MKQAIINLINKWACCHKWELLCRTDVSNDCGEYYVRKTYVCEKCGKFKVFEKI